MNGKELLDYCRVKKILDKGFGFLTSLHYNEDVFFHFNMVNDPVVKEKLEKLKRGEVYFYFTSAKYKGKRRVSKLWLDLSDVDKRLIPDFVDRVVMEFIRGDRHPFEVGYVIKQLREKGYFDEANLHKTLSSNKLVKNPSILTSFLKDSETEKLEEAEKLIEQFEAGRITKDEWTKKVFAEILRISE